MSAKNSAINNAIIDIGSNSVRIMVYSGGKILLRDLVTTQLAEGLSNDKKLAYRSINRTLDGIAELKAKAEALGETRFYCFATAAVRNAINGGDFCELLFSRFGFNIDVLSGEKEAAMGLYGALKGADGLVIDVGGGSTEIVVAKNGKIAYAGSVPCGAVVLGEKVAADLNEKNSAKSSATFEKPENNENSALNVALTLAKNALCGLDFDCLKGLLSDSGEGFGLSASAALKGVGIGGTANSLAFIALGGGVYDRAAQDGFVLKTSEFYRLLTELFDLSSRELSEKYNLNYRRACVLPFGAALLYCALSMLKLNEITLSEGDNLEGYMCFLNGEKLYEK